MRPLSTDDIDALRHVAQDAAGAPLAAHELAALAACERDGDDVMGLGDNGALWVVGVTAVRRYRVTEIRDAIRDALVVRAVVRGAREPSRERSALWLSDA